MAPGKKYETLDCSLARALELIGERWTLLVVRDALYGVRRYGDFLSHLGMPRAVLSQRLGALVAAGVMERHRYQDSPPRHEYVMTAMGNELWDPVHLLSQWGERHLSGNGPRRVFFHVPCAARLDQDRICSACGARAPLEETEVRPGPGAEPMRHDPVSVSLRRPHRMLSPLPC